jgi:hypothetical protein
LCIRDWVLAGDELVEPSRCAVIEAGQLGQPGRERGIGHWTTSKR